MSIWDAVKIWILKDAAFPVVLAVVILLILVGWAIVDEICGTIYRIRKQNGAGK